MQIDNGFIDLSTDPRENILEHNGKYFSIEHLGENGRIVKGGNGVVFNITNEEAGENHVIKISHFTNSIQNNKKIRKRINRFDREIEALYVAKENYLDYIIQIVFDGYIEIGGREFRYYVMQKCDCNLTEFLKSPDNALTLIQKIILCKKILEGIIGLHAYKIYHRDIKHDNILFLNGEPLIGDLGLSDYQDTDIFINEKGELIGPTGWFSPEAVNKFLVENSPNKNKFDCKIDGKSEVFQMGKLFWYILQGNLPIGQIYVDDFIVNDEPLFLILYYMLEYSKERRSSAEQCLEEINNYIGNK